MNPNATPNVSAIWKPLALTTALAVALATSPIKITSDLGLDESSAFAKSDKSKGKGGSKSKGKSGSKGGNSKGKSGSSNRGGSSASAKSSGGGSDSDGTSQGGKPNRTDWSKQGAAQYKAALADWKAERGKGKRVSSVEGEAKLKKLSNGNPQSRVRQYVLSLGGDVKQGDVAKVLKSWNSLNRNWNAYLNNMDNPQSLPGKQLAYIRDSIAVAAAEVSFGEAAEIAGLATDPELIDEEALAVDASSAQTALDGQELLGTLDAQTVIDAEVALKLADGDAAAVATVEETYEADILAAANDPDLLQAAKDVVAYEPGLDAASETVAAFDAFNAYMDAETVAQDSFMEASVSYSGEFSGDMYNVRTYVDGIVSMEGGLGQMVEDYDEANAEEVVEEEEVVAETDTTPVE